MENKAEIIAELKEIAPELGKNGLTGSPYTVHGLYFAEFSELLLHRIRLEADGFSRDPAIEIQEISPLLAGIRNINPYQVPEDFFKSREIKIPEEEKKIRSGKRIVSMPVRFLRYAAAACIVGIIGISVYHNNIVSKTITDPIKGLTTVSDEDMANYLDDDDIHWTPGVTSSSEISTTGLSDGEINDLFGGIPDEELEQYSASLPEEKATVN